MSPRFRVVGDDDVVEIRFDDGGMNLLSTDALVELSHAVDSLPSNARALLFDSGRPGVFAAGADMQEMRSFAARDAERFSRLGQELFARIERLPVATVAFIDGDCFGGALDLALAFDLRYVTSRARFSHPGAKIGIVTGFGGTARWRNRIPRASARRLFLDNDVLASDEAQAIGLVDAVVERVDRDSLRRVDRAKVRAMKELLAHSGGLTLEQVHLLARKLEDLYSRDG